MKDRLNMSLFHLFSRDICIELTLSITAIRYLHFTGLSTFSLIWSQSFIYFNYVTRFVYLHWLVPRFQRVLFDHVANASVIVSFLLLGFDRISDLDQGVGTNWPLMRFSKNKLLALVLLLLLSFSLTPLG